MRLLSLAAGCVLSFCFFAPAHAQVDVAPYGTRQAVQCGDFKTFDGTGAMAGTIFQCQEEETPVGIGNKLYLVEDVKFQAGAPRAFGMAADYNLADADTKSKIYAIRGTFTRVQCSTIYDTQPLYNVGRNCNEYYLKGDGQCWKTVYGDWRCHMVGFDAREPRMNIPPRGAQAVAAATPPPAQAQGPARGAAPPAQPPAPAPVQAAAPTPAPAPGQNRRRVTQDPNRPIAQYETIKYTDPSGLQAVQDCTVIEVHKGAYTVDCARTGKAFVRDIDVNRAGGAPVAESAAQVVAGPPFRPDDIVLATTMGLMDEKYWELCIVVSNEVASSNSYVLNCANGPVRALPKWVRADPNFQ